jgi:hypothetical protein
MIAFAARVTDHPFLHHFVLGAILFNAALTGGETSHDVISRHDAWLQALNLRSTRPSMVTFVLTMFCDQTS